MHGPDLCLRNYYCSNKITHVYNFILVIVDFKIISIASTYKGHPLTVDQFHVESKCVTSLCVCVCVCVCVCSLLLGNPNFKDPYLLAQLV